MCILLRIQVWSFFIVLCSTHDVSEASTTLRTRTSFQTSPELPVLPLQTSIVPSSPALSSNFDGEELFGSPEDVLPTIFSLRIPTTSSLDDVIRLWEAGDHARGVSVPLSQWREMFSPTDFRQEAQKFSMIEKVYEEFNIHCNHNFEEFEERFPGLRGKYTKLVAAVREARVARGDTKRRAGKQKV